MKPERPSSAVWTIVWPIACVVLLIAGMAELVPEGAILAIGPVIVLLWFLAVREWARRKG